MKHIIHRSVTLSDDARSVDILIPHGQPVDIIDDQGAVTESAFSPGSFTRSVRERGSKLKLYAGHHPVGKLIDLSEQPDGIKASFELEPTAAGDRAREQLRSGDHSRCAVTVRSIQAYTTPRHTVHTEVALLKFDLVGDDDRCVHVVSRAAAARRLQLLEL